MKGLDTLIKLKKRDLDDIRRELGSLENQKQQLIDASQKLSEDLRREIETAGRQPEMSQFFGGFSKRIKNRQEEIAQEVKNLDKKIEVIREQVREAFGELKKLEIAKQQKKQREEKEAQRKETIQLDEIAGQQDRRRRKKD